MKPINPTKAVVEYVSRFKTQKEAAAALEITPAYLSDLINGRRDVSEKMLAKLGLEQVVVKRRQA